MALRRRRSGGASLFPTSDAGRFIPATALILLGFLFMIFQDIGSGARYEQDLVTKEGTLLNYSFKNTESGNRSYGLWLQEFSERMVLSERDAATFDAEAFKAQVKPGDRVQVQYNRREDMMDTNGIRRLYGLAVPAKNLVYFTGVESIEKDKNNWKTWLTYLLMISGTLLFIYQLVRLKRQEHGL